MSPTVTMEILLGLCVLSAAAGAASAKMTGKPRGPVEGQRGKDIVWVATPPALVDTMLDMAQVTSDDYLVDLGSGDGRIVIAAAQRGARTLGVEYDSGLVEVAQRNIQRAGLAGRGTFLQGDLYETDFSAATVLALFLLPDNLRELAPKFASLKPGTRIVTNRFGIPGWAPAATCRIGGDSDDCPTALLYVVRRG